MLYSHANTIGETLVSINMENQRDADASTFIRKSYTNVSLLDGFIIKVI